VTPLYWWFAMTYRFLVSALLLAGIVGCSSSDPARTASVERKSIEEAIHRHLDKRSDLDFSSMKIAVDRVNVMSDDKAEAAVKFTVGGEAASSIEMTYSLEKTDGTWEVVGPPKGVQGGQTAPPAGGGALPPNHPAIGGQQPQQQQLPAGHPPVN
jgi:hypothetical protein